MFARCEMRMEKGPHYLHMTSLVKLVCSQVVTIYETLTGVVEKLQLE